MTAPLYSGRRTWFSSIVLRFANNLRLNHISEHWAFLHLTIVKKTQQKPKTNQKNNNATHTKKTYNPPPPQQNKQTKEQQQKNNNKTQTNKHHHPQKTTPKPHPKTPKRIIKNQQKTPPTK